MPSYAVYIDDVQKTFMSLGYEKVLCGEPWTFEVTLPAYESVDVGSTVLIKRDGVTVFKGIVDQIKPCHTAERGDEITLIGRNYAEKLERYVMGVGEDTGEPATLVTNALSGTGISPGTIDTYGSNITVRKDRQTRLAYIRRIAQQIGWEFKVNLDDTLDFKSNIGSDKSGSVQITIGVNGETLDWSKDLSTVRNRLYAFGKGDSEENRVTLPAPGYVEDATSQNNYGVREDVIIAKDISDPSILQVLANAVLSKLKDPAYTFRVRFLDTYASNAYDVGDIIHLTDSATGVDAAFRIHEIHLRYDAERGEEVTLVLSNRLSRLEDLFKDAQSYMDFILSNPQLFSMITGLSVNDGQDADSASDNSDSDSAGSASDSDSAGSNSDADSASNNSDSDSASSGSDSDSAASNNPYSSTLENSGNNYSSITCSVPGLGSHTPMWGLHIYAVVRKSVSDQTGYWVFITLSPDGEGGSIQPLRMYNEFKAVGGCDYFHVNIWLPGDWSGKSVSLYIKDSNGSTVSMDWAKLRVTSYGSHTHGVTSPSHGHGITSPSHGHSISSPSHGHSITSPSHTHGITSPSHGHGITSPSHGHSTTETEHTH